MFFRNFGDDVVQNEDAMTFKSLWEHSLYLEHGYVLTFFSCEMRKRALWFPLAEHQFCQISSSSLSFLLALITPLLQILTPWEIKIHALGEDLDGSGDKHFFLI